MNPAVVAVIATYRRAPQVVALLRSLAAVGPGLAGAVVVDNAGEEATARAVAESPIPCHVLAPGHNLGCGGGLALAETSAASLFPSYTHLWVLDDDVVVSPDVLSELLRAMEAEHADAASALPVDREGRIGWAPGVRDRARLAALKQRVTVPVFLQRFGPAPAAFSWCTGVSLLFTRAIFERVGPHRGDFFVRGEDVEFSLRLTSAGRGLLVPTAVVQHLPPVADQGNLAGELEKHAVLLQNVAYIFTRVPHGRPHFLMLLGNLRYFFRLWGVSFRTLAIAAQSLWRGVLLGEPAGVTRDKALTRRG